MRVLPKERQIELLKEIFRRNNPEIPVETIDWFAEVDEKLSFEENYNALKRKYPMYKWGTLAEARELAGHEREKAIEEIISELDEIHYSISEIKERMKELKIKPEELPREHVKLLKALEEEKEKVPRLVAVPPEYIKRLKRKLSEVTSELRRLKAEARRYEREYREAKERAEREKIALEVRDEFLDMITGLEREYGVTLPFRERSKFEERFKREIYDRIIRGTLDRKGAKEKLELFRVAISRKLADLAKKLKPEVAEKVPLPKPPRRVTLAQAYPELAEEMRRAVPLYVYYQYDPVGMREYIKRLWRPNMTFTEVEALLGRIYGWVGLEDKAIAHWYKCICIERGWKIPDWVKKIFRKYKMEN